MNDKDKLFFKYFNSSIVLDKKECLDFEGDETGGLDKFSFYDFVVPLKQLKFPEEQELFDYAWYVHEYIDFNNDHININFKLYALCIALYAHRNKDMINDLEDYYCRHLIKNVLSCNNVQTKLIIKNVIEFFLESTISYLKGVPTSDIFLTLSYCICSLDLGEGELGQNQKFISLLESIGQLEGGVFNSNRIFRIRLSRFLVDTL